MTRWCSTGLALALLVGCGGSAPPPPEVPAVVREVPVLQRAPLEEYVPAAGLRWLVVARPREIAETEWLRASLSRLFPEERLAAYAAATGLDLRQSEQALVAGFDYGTLFLARTDSANDRVEELFRRRLLDEPVVHHAHPDVLVLLGMIRETPSALVSERGHLVGVAFGDPTLARIVEGYARRRLESATALRGAALALLPDALHGAPLRFYAPGPFESEWGGGARGILGAATAVGVAVRPLKPDRIRVEVEVTGDWSSDAGRARASAEAFYADLAASSLGRLLALDEPVAPPIVIVLPDRLSLSVDLMIQPFARGLHAAVSADVWELLELPSLQAIPANAESTNE